jgi:CTD small phosphatase-like protein 2
LVLDELDKNRRISYRLYRQHTVQIDKFFIKVNYLFILSYFKDLSKLGRCLSKTFIIDNVAENFKLQESNGLNIKNFEGDENDKELIELTEDLKNITINYEDVRHALESIREKMITRYNHQDSEEFSFNLKNPEEIVD